MKSDTALQDDKASLLHVNHFCRPVASSEFVTEGFQLLIVASITASPPPYRAKSTVKQGLRAAKAIGPYGIIAVDANQGVQEAIITCGEVGQLRS